MTALPAGCSLCLGLLTLAAPPPQETAARLDALVEAKWQALGLQPVPPADDPTFLRRVALDLTGRVPTVHQARAFLEDRDPARRQRLVDALLAGPDFTDHWGRVWAQLLTGQRPTKHEKYDGRVLRSYLSEALAANKPYREVVRELICGEGLNDASGPANFLLRYEAKPADLAGAVSKHFLGLTLQCAQCHDHPFAPWKQNDFWGLAAFFGRIRMLEHGEGNEYYTAVLETRRGELMVPDPDGELDDDGNLPNKKVLPRLPGGGAAAADGKRRQALADWVTGDRNPYFARHLVNRLWAQLFGAPLVDSLERGGEDRDGKHPQLLNLLADDFTAHGQDLKRLLRLLVLSRPYQLGTGSPLTAAETRDAAGRLRQVRNLACFPVRPLSADQLYQSIVQATGHAGDEDAPDPAEDLEDEEEDADRPVDLLGERALTVQRSLALLNSEYVHRAVQAGARTAVLVDGTRSAAAQVEWLFLATLSRRPTAEEASGMRELLQKGKGKRGLEDVLWVLLNSVEFTTNH